MTNITVNRTDLLDSVLIPVCRFGNNATLVIEGGKISAIGHTDTASKSTIFMLAETITETDTEETITLNIGNPKKYIDVLRGIQDDSVTFQYDGSSLYYESPSSAIRKFRFHLLDKSFEEKVPLDRSKFHSFKPLSSFNVSSESVKSVISAFACLPTFDKVYLSTENGEVIASQTDKSIDGQDSIDVVFSDGFAGSTFSDVIISQDVFRFVAQNKMTTCRVDVTERGIVVFNVFTDTSTITYIVPKKVR